MTDAWIGGESQEHIVLEVQGVGPELAAIRFQVEVLLFCRMRLSLTFPSPCEGGEQRAVTITEQVQE